MKKIVKFVAPVALLFSLSACGEPAAGGYSDDPGERSIVPSTTAYVKEVTLDSGIVCVIFRDGSMGGISCDWSNNDE